jgi:hypothetical protein
VEPIPPELCELRFVVPLLAQDASYFAASARMASLRSSSMDEAVNFRDLPGNANRAA